MRQAAILLLFLFVAEAGASDLDEFKVKRESVFEFAAKPVATRAGRHVAIRFETKGYCDVTVAIEESSGRIVRHLACGVLGPNAPEPLAKNSKKQALVWDGKDDQGRYIIDEGRYGVRVSLGLKPFFERVLYWSPKKRMHQGSARWGFVGTCAGLPTPRIAAAPEGVFVFEGRGFDHLRLFSHAGDYLRTVYPPPPGKLDQVAGLAWHRFPQDGLRLPLKHDILQSSFLTSGPSGMVDKVGSMFGTAATALAVRDGRVALVHRRLNRLAPDGASPLGPDKQKRLPLTGPATDVEAILRLDGIEQHRWPVSPSSAAFSPDGRRLYLAGYMWRQGRHTVRIQKECFQGVLRVDYESDQPPELFAGSMKMYDSGTENGRFRDATSVACDEAGRVYVTDFMNDRIQVFSPRGEHLKNIAADKPALLRIHRRTGELYVFTWAYHHGRTFGIASQDRKIEIQPRLTVLGPFDDPRVRASYPLPLVNHAATYTNGGGWAGLQYTAEIDSWTDPVTIWLVPGVPGKPGEPAGFESRGRGTSWRKVGILLLEPRQGRLVVKRDFAAEAERAVKRLWQPMFARQRLYVDPTTGMLYVAEGQTTHYKAFKDVLRIDAATGDIDEVALPFDAEDMAFDGDGRLYLKSHDLLVRYEPPWAPGGTGAWREIPFDYGEQRPKVCTSSSRDARQADASSALVLYNGTGWHKGGLFINLRGDILTSSYVTKGDVVPFLPRRTDEQQLGLGRRANYVPRIYPGRLRFGELHVWDKHGQLIHEDAVMGLVDCYGVGLDARGDIYAMAAPTRVLDGERYFNRLSGTLMKFHPGKGRIISQNSHLIPVKVTEDVLPRRPHDLVKGGSPAWVVGAEWFYGGVGYCGKNAMRVGGHCACYNSRFALDYFGRSFAPEVRRFRVAVLDSSGNLILRIGQYGNADSAGPGSLVPLGGDEIGLMHGAYVATQTDRRVFIADPGNARVISATLDYHVTERVTLAEN